MENFGSNAQHFIKNPLGIFGLMIVVIYGLGVSVFATGKLQVPQMATFAIVGFLVLFPFFILFVFYSILTKYPLVLYGPSDFKDEKALIELQMMLLQSSGVEDEEKIDRTAKKLLQIKKLGKDGTIAKVLWVDDNPKNNLLVVRQLERMGIIIDTAISSKEALLKLKENNYTAIISDMGRPEDKEAGYSLLSSVRKNNSGIPYYIYAGSSRLEHHNRVLEAGGNGSTNSSYQLTKWLTGNAIDSILWD